MTKDTKPQNWQPPPLFPKNHQLLDRFGTWEIDDVAQALFGPEINQRDALWGARYAVFDAYEFARGRFMDARRLALARQHLSAVVSDLSKLQKTWRTVSPRFARAAKEFQQFPITAAWWSFGLPFIGDADRPPRLSQLVMAGQKADQFVEGMEALASLSKDLEELGRGHPKAVLRYAFAYSLVIWWREVTGRWPPRERKASRPGKSAKSEMFFDFMERARKDAGIRGTLLDSPIKQIVSKTSRQA